jgi:hypothetical protein
MIRVAVIAAIGGAALAVVVTWLLITQGVVNPPSTTHEHPDKRDLQTEIAFDHVSKQDFRIKELEALNRWWYCPVPGDDETITLPFVCRSRLEDCVKENWRCIPVSGAWCNDGKDGPECFFSKPMCDGAARDTNSRCLLKAPPAAE